MDSADIKSEYLPEENIILIKIQGLYDANKSELLTDSCVNAIRRNDCKNLLLDFRDGKYLVDIVSAADRPNVLLERGIHLELFKNLHEAKEWLKD